MLEFVKQKKTKWTLEDEIQSVLDQLAMEEAHTERYKALTENYERLMEAKTKQLRYKVVPVLASGSVTLAGIGLIMGFEQLHVISTKAFQLLPKAKVL